MKYVMFEHAGCGNHGCEAIVRSTINMLGPDNEYFLQTLNFDEDIKFEIDLLASLVKSKDGIIPPNSLRGIGMRVKSRLNSSVDFDVRESLYKHKDLIKKNSIALSIGGDNYCYNGIINSMRDKLNAFSAANIPVVLWGCSVDTDHLNNLIITDLKKYKLITARESISFDILQNSGITDSVVRCSDPAFTLPTQQVRWNEKILDNNSIIGINVSDFMKYYNAYTNATYKNFKNLIEHLLNNTDNYIALIPHVRQTGNDDLNPCRQLANEFNNNRILVADEAFNCMQLKYIISKCKLFVGCRTHSTIAAYSTCVPTLVVGYSTKAKGIAKDIFGDYKDLLVDVREFKTDNDLLNAFLVFSERSHELKRHLQKNMPEYIKKAYNAKDALKNRFCL